MPIRRLDPTTDPATLEDWESDYWWRELERLDREAAHDNALRGAAFAIGASIAFFWAPLLSVIGWWAS